MVLSKKFELNMSCKKTFIGHVQVERNHNKAQFILQVKVFNLHISS
jgi:hypothetical protein